MEEKYARLLGILTGHYPPMETTLEVIDGLVKERNELDFELQRANNIIQDLHAKINRLKGQQ